MLELNDFRALPRAYGMLVTWIILPVLIADHLGTAAISLDESLSCEHTDYESVYDN